MGSYNYKGQMYNIVNSKLRENVHLTFMYHPRKYRRIFEITLVKCERKGLKTCVDIGKTNQM